ncbi:helix-turn-helix domain-containing protein [Sorangium sp. So ce381]|uniref:helix-turn-helix domain-containing protein n=1 Tax=Sorangium sp. So ce381 TaxID=3133307 RepID=UPI003F5C680D
MASRASRAFRSAIPFVRAGTREPIEALRQAEIRASSRSLRWTGMVAELGVNPSWETDHLAVAGHYLAINLADAPLRFERKGQRGFERVEMPPGSLWLQPAEVPFSHRVSETTIYGALVLDPARLARLAGVRELLLEPRVGLVDAQIEHVLRALLVEVSRGGATGALFADAMLSGLAARLGARHAARPERPARGGLSPATLRRLLDYIEAHLGDDFGLEALSGVAGLSPAHMAREFKRALGEPPLAYVTRRRLDRAREALLAGGRPIGELAGALGFADQSHLTRLFKRRFGITPGALARGR